MVQRNTLATPTNRDVKLFLPDRRKEALSCALADPTKPVLRNRWNRFIPITVFSLINLQLTIPAGLGWDESLESLKVLNLNFQFNYWSPNCFESLEVDFQCFKLSQ